jgi:CheY-like chemotaxis protein
LLADDSVTIRKVVELTFADEGIDVTTAPDAETAMQQFVEVQPDIVLVDIGLPGTTGYQICEMIKQDDGTKHIPVLLLVGSFEPFDQDEAERVCSDGFLTKPFHSIRDLVARVWDLLGRETSVEEPAAASATPSADVADIEHLYDSSFANTAEIEEFDTVDDLLGDAGMDDELIEASAPTYNGSEARGDDPSTHEGPAGAKEFDWSPEALVVEKEYRESDMSTDEYDGFDDISLHETVADDQAGREWRPDNGSSIVLDPVTHEPAREAVTSSDDEAAAGETEETPAPETLVPDPGAIEYSTAETPDDELETESVSIESQDSSEAELAATEPDEAPIYAGNSPFEETVEKTSSELPPQSVEEGTVDEPSPELISLIAQRVIDHLSDNVVRDIAKEAVPRIAEKLIREALDQERKT